MYRRLMNNKVVWLTAFAIVIAVVSVSLVFGHEKPSPDEKDNSATSASTESPSSALAEPPSPAPTESPAPAPTESSAPVATEPAVTDTPAPKNEMDALIDKWNESIRTNDGKMQWGLLSPDLKQRMKGDYETLQWKQPLFTAIDPANNKYSVISQWGPQDDSRGVTIVIDNSSLFDTSVISLVEKKIDGAWYIDFVEQSYVYVLPNGEEVLPFNHMQKIWDTLKISLNVTMMYEDTSEKYPLMNNHSEVLESEKVNTSLMGPGILSLIEHDQPAVANSDEKTYEYCYSFFQRDPMHRYARIAYSLCGDVIGDVKQAKKQMLNMIPQMRVPNLRLKPAAPWGSANVFDPTQIQVGDKIAGMSVNSILLSQQLPLNIVYIDFSGQVELTGTYKYFRKEEEFVGGSIMFTLDDASAAKMPIVKDVYNSHVRNPSFVLDFSKEEDKKAFGLPGSEGSATIVVQDYKIQYAPKEIWSEVQWISAKDVALLNTIVLPDGRQVLPDQKPVEWKDIKVATSSFYWNGKDPLPYLYGSLPVVKKSENMGTPDGAVLDLVERTPPQSDPSQKPTLEYWYMVHRKNPDAPEYAEYYYISSVITGDQQTAKEQILQLVKLWNPPGNK